MCISYIKINSYKILLNRNCIFLRKAKKEERKSNTLPMYSTRKKRKNGSGLRGDPNNSQNGGKFTRMFRKERNFIRNDDLVRGMDTGSPFDRPLVYGYHDNHSTSLQQEDMGLVYGKEDKRREIWTTVPLEWNHIWINFVWYNFNLLFSNYW